MSELAGSLGNLAVMLRDVGRQEEALAASQEASSNAVADAPAFSRQKAAQWAGERRGRAIRQR